MMAAATTAVWSGITRSYAQFMYEHLAASKGYEAITHFVIQEGIVNISDNFGSTPLLEALKNGNDGVASVLVKEGVALKLNDASSFLCIVIAKGDSDFLKRLLSNSIDQSLGVVVYGDLSTSPLYVYKSTFVVDIQHSYLNYEYHF